MLVPAHLPTRHKGAVILLLYPLFCGLPAVILPKFDPDQFCRTIERYKVTASWWLNFSPRPAWFIAHTATNKYGSSSLKLLTSGADADIMSS
jgi:acyl-coenzyme A synthetase/AMP-(fatty) acid ligase